MSFRALLDGAEPLEGGLGLAIPEDWHQGRTAYGGFSAALALAAARQIGGANLPPLRSLQVSFAGPLFGHVEARARVLRAGRNATWIAAEIARGSEVGLLASFVFMHPLASTLSLDRILPPSDVIAPNVAARFTEGEQAPLFRRHHMEVRFALPRSAEKHPDLCWWVRLNEHGVLDTETELVLIADALPPGVLPLLPPGTPLSSMTWQANLLKPAPVTRDGWWLLRSRGDFAENGCSSQAMELWNADGRAAMAGTQSIALFG